MNRIGVILCLALLCGLANPAWAVWSCEKKEQVAGASNGYNGLPVSSLPRYTGYTDKTVIKSSIDSDFDNWQCGNIVIFADRQGNFPEQKCSDYYQNPSSGDTYVCKNNGLATKETVYGNSEHTQIYIWEQRCTKDNKKKCQAP